MGKKVRVTQRALVQRINRVLARQDEVLKATRGDRWRGEQGDYYIVDVRLNCIVHKHVDLEAAGRKLKVLQKWEEVA
jgi:hypothetical protein